MGQISIIKNWLSFYSGMTQEPLAIVYGRLLKCIYCDQSIDLTLFPGSKKPLGPLDRLLCVCQRCCYDSCHEHMDKAGLCLRCHSLYTKLST